MLQCDRDCDAMTVDPVESRSTAGRGCLKGQGSHRPAAVHEEASREVDPKAKQREGIYTVN